MFSGIVERTGRVESVTREPAGVRLRIRADFADDPAPGASVAVNGVCLTVERAAEGEVEFTVVPETGRRTNLGALLDGSRVNLERPLRVGEEIGGHWVQGHVDGIAVVETVDRRNGEVRVGVTVPEPWRRYVAEKGSVTLDGISLTVAAWESPRLTVALIPATLERTTASSWREGSRINLEVDVVARYVERLLAAQAKGEPVAPRSEET